MVLPHLLASTPVGADETSLAPFAVLSLTNHCTCPYLAVATFPSRSTETLRHMAIQLNPISTSREWSSKAPFPPQPYLHSFLPRFPARRLSICTDNRDPTPYRARPSTSPPHTYLESSLHSHTHKSLTLLSPSFHPPRGQLAGAQAS